MGIRLDEIDKRIIYYLMFDARNISAPKIAEEVNVTAGTIRNRIDRLEEQGILTGYHASVDFEIAEGHLTTLLVGTVNVPDRAKIAKQVLDIPGVIHVRELMTGRRNLHVTAVGADTDDLTRIARELSTLGIEIEEENLVRHQQYQPYQPYGPEGSHGRRHMTDFMSLAGGAEVLELTIPADAPITGKTLHQAAEEGLIRDEDLIVSIERDESVITPKGSTKIRADDVVTVFSRGGVAEDVIRTLVGESASEQAKANTE